MSGLLQGSVDDGRSGPLSGHLARAFKSCLCMNQCLAEKCGRSGGEMDLVKRTFLEAKTRLDGMWTHHTQSLL